MQTISVLPYLIDYDYLDQLHIPVIAGRDFSHKFGTDSTNATIVNEAAVRQLVIRCLHSPSDDVLRRVIGPAPLSVS